MAFGVLTSAGEDLFDLATGVFSPTNTELFRRTEVLHQENELLRQQLNSTSQLLTSQSPAQTQQNDAEASDPMSGPAAALLPISYTANWDQDSAGQASTSRAHVPPEVEPTPGPAPSHSSGMATSSHNSPTLARTLAGIRLESDEIDEIFRLY